MNSVLSESGDSLDEPAIGRLLEAGAPFSMVVGHGYMCSDGSGTFVLDATVEMDPNLDPPHAGATWTINGGTGSYASITASGTIGDDEPETVYSGTVAND